MSNLFMQEFFLKRIYMIELIPWTKLLKSRHQFINMNFVIEHIFLLKSFHMYVELSIITINTLQYHDYGMFIKK